MSGSVTQPVPLARLLSRVPLARFGDVILWIGVASGGVVMFEPAPYDLILIAQAIVAFLLGLAIPRSQTPFVVLLLLFNIGGILALIPVVYNEPLFPPTFVAVSLFLAFVAVFIAAATADRSDRIDIVLQATIAGAVLAGLAGIVGWVLKMESLTLYGRAKGFFKDPNVYGPFLVLPLIVLAREFLVRPFREVWWKSVPTLIILGAIFLSASRAAWGLAAGCLVFLGFIVFLNERSPMRRFRLIAIAIGGLVVIIAGIAAALSIDSVAELMVQRAKLVQDYDGARLGRFARHLIGFEWATQLPLGLGPYQFGHYFPEDPHNVYLKSLMVYGWLGFLSYVTLAFMTIGKLFPLMFKPRPWQGAAQSVWIVLTGHQLMSWIIDSDHWRHYFLLWGLAWGMIALEAAHMRRRARLGADATGRLQASPT